MSDKSSEATISLELVPPASRGRAVQVLDRAIANVCARLLRDGLQGALELTLPSGVTMRAGSHRPGGAARIVLSDYGVFWRSLRRGGLGFAESYLRGEWSTDDLERVFRFFLENRDVLERTGRGAFRVRRSDRAYHASRANTREMSRENISEHYDLGNAFYRAWLDPSMTYSSGLYRDAFDTLEAAQEAKYDCVLDALDLSPRDRLLEIGCGWGGLALRAASRGADVTGLTLSSEQLVEATQRAAAAGLGDRIELRLQDYRDVQGTFDRIASIEMIEAVGEEHMPAYFRTIADRLRPGGMAVVQAITIDEEMFDRYRRRPDFIQRYIFPGGMLPTKTMIAREASAAGIACETVRLFGDSYALTLREWRRRFHEAWPAIGQLGFDERFKRMWDYYLSYCAAGFEHGSVDVGIYRLTKGARRRECAISSR